MPTIIIRLDVMLAKHKMSLTELSEAIDVRITKLSMFKTGKTKIMNFKTLAAICDLFDCTPGDILEYVDDDQIA